MQLKGDISGLVARVRQLEDVYLELLADAGEKAVQEAIAEGNYQNITGNLRSSIG